MEVLYISPHVESIFDIVQVDSSIEYVTYVIAKSYWLIIA